MKLAASNPTLSESFRDTRQLCRCRDPRVRPSLICGIAESSRRSGAIKAGKIQPRNIRRYESRYAIKDRRTCLEKCSNGTYNALSHVVSCRTTVEMAGIISLNRAFYNGRDNAKAKAF